MGPEANGVRVDRELLEEEGDIQRHFNVAPGNYQLVYRALLANAGNALEET